MKSTAQKSESNEMTNRETPHPPPIIENMHQAINDDSPYEKQDEIICQALAATIGFHRGRF